MISLNDKPNKNRMTSVVNVECRLKSEESVFASKPDFYIISCQLFRMHLN